MSATEGEDYIKCALCDFVGRSIKNHVKNKHGLSKDEYQQRHGSAICKKSQVRYSETENYNWVERAKENDPDKFEEWRSNLGEKISEGIMKTPSARRTRRKNMTKWNKSSEGRLVSSIAAQETSSRPEIQEQRAENLQRWRDENPEEFYKKCIVKMHSAWKSKPETCLGSLLDTLYPGQFAKNQRFKSRTHIKTTKSSTRQIDLWDKKNKIVVEFDGVYHFKQIRKDQLLENVKKKDKELNTVLPSLGFTLIRISYDQFDYKQGGNFNANCIARMIELIERKEPGIYLIGEAYENNNQKP